MAWSGLSYVESMNIFFFLLNTFKINKIKKHFMCGSVYVLLYTATCAVGHNLTHVKIEN